MRDIQVKYGKEKKNKRIKKLTVGQKLVLIVCIFVLKRMKKLLYFQSNEKQMINYVGSPEQMSVNHSIIP